MNSRYSKHCNGILVVNYLLIVSLCFTEMNSRYSKYCNGILVVNYLLTVPLCFTEMNSRYSKHCNGILVVNYLLTVSLCLYLFYYKIDFKLQSKLLWYVLRILILLFKLSAIKNNFAHVMSKMIPKVPSFS